MTNDEKLMWLRIQLFGAMQTLKGDDQTEFWRLIDDITECRPIWENQS